MLLFFFKQKTAYEMRISYWSSDVCSSDLLGIRRRDRIDLARDQAVDAAQYRILLMDRGRNAGLERREQRGKRGIATETEHRLGLEGAIEFARHRTTRAHVRSEERCVGKECVRTCKSWWAQFHSTKKVCRT